MSYGNRSPRSMPAGRRSWLVSLVATALILSALPVLWAAWPAAPDRAQARKEMADGNYAEAYESFRQLALDTLTPAPLASQDVVDAVNCLQQLGRVGEVDALLDGVMEAHAGKWRVAQAAAAQLGQLPHFGAIVAGEFQRGPQRGGGRMFDSAERDRVRALGWLTSTLEQASQDDQKAEAARFFLQTAETLASGRMGGQSWRLQYATDLTALPDYDEFRGYWRGGGVGADYSAAPVDENGDPVFYSAPRDWNDAESDGRRWRWALTMAAELDAAAASVAQLQFADFLQQQFGVQTLGDLSFLEQEGRAPQASPFAVEQLSDEETIARLANGVRKFGLPAEFNFIRLFRQLADQDDGETALQRLVVVYLNRRQLPKAAEVLRESIQRFGPGPQNYKQDQLDQIVGAWGRFEPTRTQPANQGVSVYFRSRNAKEARFTARVVKIESLLADIKRYLKSDPGNQLDGQQLQLGDLGYRLVMNNERKYLGEQVAAWDLALNPLATHRTSRVEVQTPLQRAGAYLVTATIDGGNESNIVVWVADTAIVRHPMQGRNLYFVADARNGNPIAAANLEFLGYRSERLSNGRRRIAVSNFAETTDANGLAEPPAKDLDRQKQWLAIARGPGDRLAYLGFAGVWTGENNDQQYNAVRAYTITDRPVYRPQQDVKFKIWVRRSQYDQDNSSQFAGQAIEVKIIDPRNEEVNKATLIADSFGGVEGSFFLPIDAALGVYRIQTDHGGGAFRVEEYKKPEFEVTVQAPAEPIRLGETIQAKVEARYYFGLPVAEGTVAYKVTRSAYQQDWYPPAQYDWCYGPGYWWFAYDYSWYPGWSRWAGCLRPSPWWYGRPSSPPELVLEGEAPLQADGTFAIEIDTKLAQTLHGDQDHRYEITAEVRDASRRVIVGQGSVLATRKPFQIFTWLDHGYYRQGDTIASHFRAQTADHKPVAGPAEIELLRVEYDQQRQPRETSVARWDVAFSDQGEVDLKFVAKAGGQYRLVCRKKHQGDQDQEPLMIEGGYVFTVMGQGYAAGDYRFNALELIPQQREYAPGDKVALQINTDQVNSTVLLFIRPANGVYPRPEVIRIKGKSTLHEIAITTKDMPNFYVEAMTISNGKVHSEVREIVVPPAKRVLNMTVSPDKSEYRPGDQATVKLHLEESNGENLVGSSVVAVYDKSVEYISGGSNVPDIREFFWKWRRHHHPNRQDSLEAYSNNYPPRGKKTMQDLGLSIAVGAFDPSVRADAGIRRLNTRGGGDLFAEGMAFAAADGVGAPAGAAMAKAGGDAPAEVQPTVRSNFADTALWVGALTTDSQGNAEVSFKVPENLTTWTIKAWGMGQGTKVGSATADVISTKNLLVRPQTPRFLIERDEAVLSAIVHNELSSAKEVRVALELASDALVALDDVERYVTIESGGEARIDWRVRVAHEGQAVVRMKALTDEESDAVEQSFPCYVHGMLKTESWAATIAPAGEKAVIQIKVPSQRRVDQTLLQIRYSPSLAGAMLDATPYLLDYPYGCTEQTLNRFLPAVLTQKALLRMGIDLAAVEQARNNLNAQELGDRRGHAEQWKRYDRDPVFDQAVMDDIVKQGVKRLTNMQLADGGWGWFSGARNQLAAHHRDSGPRSVGRNAK